MARPNSRRKRKARIYITVPKWGQPQLPALATTMAICINPTITNEVYRRAPQPSA